MVEVGQEFLTFLIETVPRLFPHTPPQTLGNLNGLTHLAWVWAAPSYRNPDSRKSGHDVTHEIILKLLPVPWLPLYRLENHTLSVYTAHHFLHV